MIQKRGRKPNKLPENNSANESGIKSKTGIELEKRPFSSIIQDEPLSGTPNIKNSDQ